MITKGQKISDRYEIIKSIGEGGMANVYLACDTILNRKVAIKILRGDLANDEKFIRRFQREAIAASSLSHPNIVKMYDVGEDNGTYYIVMEYVEGRTLKQLLKKRGNLTISEVIDIMLQLTDGIAHAHDGYIIHRDLKPQNIMIADDGAIKITDFGIAMALNSTQLTQTNSVMGSVHYLPPEQASGKGSTTKSDIYSMGILFFELLTGKLPFKGDNAVEIALKHMSEPLPNIKKLNPNIPQSVENIVLKSTAKNPKNRYDDVKEMYNDLKVALLEENLNQPAYVYKYPEMNLEEKELQLEEEQDENPVAKKIAPAEEKSGSNIIIWVLSIILLLGVGGLIFVLYPTFQKEDNIKVPDVTNLYVDQAEKVLISEGFKVAAETCKEHHNTIVKGKVTSTNPIAGRSRPKGSIITLCESLGKNNIYVIENYVGKNQIEVKTTLEQLYKMEVEIEPKSVEITEGMDVDLIIGQSLKEGTQITISEETPAKIILYVPEHYEQYPDFVEEGWTIEEIEEFVKNYNIKLEIKYEENKNYPEGTILKQSRSGKIVNGVKLIITVSKIPEEVSGVPEEEIKTENNQESNQEVTTTE